MNRHLRAQTPPLATGIQQPVQNAVLSAIVPLLMAWSLLLGAMQANAALELSADIERSTVAAGGTALVSVILSNSGTSIESAIEVRLPFPNGLADLAETLVEGPVNAGASCATDSGNSATCTVGEPVVWSIGTLSPGQAVAMSFPATTGLNVADGTAIDLVFTLSAGSSTLAVESATLTIDRAAAIALSIKEDKDPAVPGDQVEFTISYGNFSSSTISNASLLFSLPPATTFATASAGGANAGNQVSWNLGSLPAGSVNQQIVTATVASAAPLGRHLRSSASVSGTRNGLPTSRSTGSTAYVGNGSALDLSFTVDRESSAPGSALLANLTVSNPTNQLVLGGRLQIRHPALLADLSESLAEGPVDRAASCVQNSGNSGTCTSYEFLNFALGNVPPGQAQTLSFPVESFLSQSSGSLISYVARLSDDSGPLETEDQTIALDSSVGLDVAIDEDADPASAGSQLTYDIRYGNFQRSSATNSTLTFRLPDNVTVTSISGNGVQSADAISWELGSIPAGLSARQRVVVTINAGVAEGTLLESTATISGNQNSLPTTRTTSSPAFVGPGSPLAMALSINPEPLAPGSQALIELVVTNPSAATVFDANVRLRMPNGIISVAESLAEGPIDAAGSCETDSGSASACTANETFAWQLNNLGPGDSRRLTIPATAFNALLPGSIITFEAIATDDSTSFDRESRSIRLSDSAALSLAINEDRDPVPAGERMAYDLSYGNASGAAVINANAELRLPADVTFESASNGGIHTNGVVSWSLGSIPNETIGKLRVVGIAAATAADGTLLPVTGEMSGMQNTLQTVQQASEAAYVGAGTPLALSFELSPNPTTAGAGLTAAISVSNPTSSVVFGSKLIVRTPAGLESFNESTVTGPLDADDSCQNDTGNSGTCTANEFLVWDLGSLSPAQTVAITIPTLFLSSSRLGEQIPWEVYLSDDSGANTTRSAVLQLGSASTSGSGAGAGPIFSSLLPASRSVQVGQAATAFATIVNSGSSMAIDCVLEPATVIPAIFSYQATDPLTNASIGTPDTPVDIPGGSNQSFVFSITPSGPIQPTDVALNFFCANTESAPVFVNLNTLLLSAATTPVLDVIGLTTETDLVAPIDATNFTLFGVASANVGSTGSVTVTVDDGGRSLPADLLICLTDPTTGACSSAIGNSVTLSYGADSTASFAVFVKPSAPIAADAAANRVFIRFIDGNGVSRGATSSAIRTP